MPLRQARARTLNSVYFSAIVEPTPVQHPGVYHAELHDA